MSLWRKLFPKYACRRCKDTHILESCYALSRCDCPGSQEQVRKMLVDFTKSMSDLDAEVRLKRFAKKLEGK